jgi:hypothetical protein
MFEPANRVVPRVNGQFPVLDARAKILGLQAAMMAMPDHVDPPLTHTYAPGAYGRTIYMPAGLLIIGKIHKHAHLNIISQGKCSVFTPSGMRDLEGFCIFTSEPGTKRVVLCHTDVIWTTVHVGEVMDSQDLERIEDEVIAPTFEDYDALMAQAMERIAQ